MSFTNITTSSAFPHKLRFFSSPLESEESFQAPLSLQCVNLNRDEMESSEYSTPCPSSEATSSNLCHLVACIDDNPLSWSGLARLKCATPPSRCLALASTAGSFQSEPMVKDRLHVQRTKLRRRLALKRSGHRMCWFLVRQNPPGICVTSFVLAISHLDPSKLKGALNQAETPLACSPLVLFYSFTQFIYR